MGLEGLESKNPSGSSISSDGVGGAGGAAEEGRRNRGGDRERGRDRSRRFSGGSESCLELGDDVCSRVVFWMLQSYVQAGEIGLYLRAAKLLAGRECGVPPMAVVVKGCSTASFHVQFEAFPSPLANGGQLLNLD